MSKSTLWHLCIQHANGSQAVLKTFTERELALRQVDAIYAKQGYPMLYAYVVCPAS